MTMGLHFRGSRSLAQLAAHTAIDEQEKAHWDSFVHFTQARHRAFVVFEDNNGIAALRYILKPKYRHCWILLWDGARWISMDPMANHIEVMTYNEIMDKMDLPAWLADRYTAVIEMPLRRDGEKELFFRWLSCVEIVKHYLGIKAFWVWTPYQLYNHLMRHGGKDARVTGMENRQAEPAAERPLHGQGNPEGGQNGITNQPAMDMASA